MTARPFGRLVFHDPPVVRHDPRWLPPAVAPDECGAAVRMVELQQPFRCTRRAGHDGDHAEHNQHGQTARWATA